MRREEKRAGSLIRTLVTIAHSHERITSFSIKGRMRVSLVVSAVGWRSSFRADP